MAKKITIEYDIDSKDVKIAGGETLALTQQLRILKKELQRADLKPEQFDILRKKVGEVEDNIARTTVRSKDFFGVISTLPGPIGQFGGSLLAVVDTLKVFSSFTFKDIKNSLSDIGDDIVEITDNFLGFGNTNKAVADASREVADASKEASNSVDGLGDSLTNTAAEAGATGGVVKSATKDFENYTSKTYKATDGTISFLDNLSNLKKQGLDITVKSIEANVDTLGKLDATYTDAAGKTRKLTIAQVDAIKSGKALTNTTNGLVVAQQQATFWTSTLGRTISGVLIASGIGIAIVLIGELIKVLYDLVSGTKAAEKAQKDFNNELERTTTLLDLDLADTRRRNAIRLAELKATGATEKELRDQQLKELKENLALVNQAVSDAAALENKTMKREDEKSLEDLEVITKKRNELEQKAKDIRTQIRVAELEGIAADRKKRIELSKEETNRRLKELDALIQLEIEKDDTNKEVLEKHLNERRDIIKKNGDLTQAEVTLLESQNSKRIEDALNEDTNRYLEYLRKIEDLRIGAIQDEEEARLESISNKLNFDKIALSKDKEFIKASEEEKAQLLKNLEIASQKEILKVREEFFLRKFQQTQQQNIAEIELATRLKEQEVDVNNIRIQNAGDLKAVYGDFFFGNKGLMALYNKYFVDLRKVYKDEFELNTALYDAEEGQLITALESKRLSQEKYDEQIRLLNEKRLQNNQQYVERQIQLDQLEIDSKRAVADKFFEVGQRTVDFYNALIAVRQADMDEQMLRFDDQLKLYQKDSEAYNEILAAKRKAEEENLEKIKKMQTAAALADAAVQIARIIIDTQRAIVAFSAAVAGIPGGPLLVPPYAAASKALAALSIATITAQGIAKIKGIQSQRVTTEVGGGDSSNGLGRGYADGGIVRGPGGPKSDSIPARLSNGEAVMTSGAVTMFAPLLSMMNQMGGGASFATGLNTPLQDKPAVSQPGLDQSPMILKTYVVESELTNIQQRQARLKDLSTL